MNQTDTTASARAPWYAGQYKDAVFYLLIAVLLTELVVGVIAFLYGVTHAAPETPGGPPMARFPWLGWAMAAVLAPVGLLLIVHLTGLWLSRTLNRDQDAKDAKDTADVLPERLQRFYAILRNTPTVVVLVGILLLGAGLFFVEGALSGLISLGGRLLDYTPWIAGCLAALLTGCYLTHRIFVYRHRRMEQEYAYRREVLERTGIVLADKNCMQLQPGLDSPLALPTMTVEALSAATADAAPVERAEHVEQDEIEITEHEVIIAPEEDLPPAGNGPEQVPPER